MRRDVIENDSRRWREGTAVTCDERPVVKVVVCSRGGSVRGAKGAENETP